MNSGSTILAILYAMPQRLDAVGAPVTVGANDDALDELQNGIAFEPQEPFDLQELGAPFETTLEEALAAIERQPRGYVEPDGSFSLHGPWSANDVGERGESSPARIDGEVYDFDVPGKGCRVHHVDVRGPVIAELWQTIFDALSPRGAEGVVVFLPDDGEALSGDAFLARLSAS